MNITVITGASSGLGKEFAKFADKIKNTDEIWLIARREDRLTELEEDLETKCRILALDLTSDEDTDRIKNALHDHKPQVRLLINSAGLGKMGNYSHISTTDSDTMIDLDCRGAVRMTEICLPYMDKGARILEISSSAAFQPLPYMNIYAASKAFLLNYSRALRWELFGRGIRVTAVCPYWIKDTEFISTAKKTGYSKGFRHFFLASRAKTVARWALLDSRLNFAVSTPSPMAFIIRIFSKFVPHCIIMMFWSALRKL